MAKKLIGSARRELIVAVRGRYSTSAPSVKREILREFAAITGYHRKSAIRILNGNGDDSAAAIPRQRPRVYDHAFCSRLIVLWEASDRVCGKRLRALLPLLVPALERHGHLVLEPSARIKLLAVSAATIDRLLAEARGLCDRRRGSAAAQVLVWPTSSLLRQSGIEGNRQKPESGETCLRGSMRRTTARSGLAGMPPIGSSGTGCTARHAGNSQDIP